MGGKNSVIDTVFFDKGRNSVEGIKYIPNIDLINKCIQEWLYEDIEFLGIFHTHLRIWESLSNEDIRYIKKIMLLMPESIKYLFFPIVFPGEYVKSYRAEKRSQKIYIIEDYIKIIQ